MSYKGKLNKYAARITHKGINERDALMLLVIKSHNNMNITKKKRNHLLPTTTEWHKYQAITTIKNRFFYHSVTAAQSLTTLYSVISVWCDHVCMVRQTWSRWIAVRLSNVKTQRYFKKSYRHLKFNKVCTEASGFSTISLFANGAV